MTKKQIIKLLYWFLASVLIAFLLQNSIPEFWSAWLIALFLLPIALVVKYSLKKTEKFKGFKRWLRYFFLTIISLYWGYLAIAIAYWYFLELNAEHLDKVLINPVFIWILIGFFVLLDFVLFKKHYQKQSETISIYSNRKRTSIRIDNIAFVESRGDFTIVNLKDGSQLKTSIKISDWTKRLDDFLRIHRSFLINTDVSTFKGNEILVNGKWILPISRGYKQNVMAFFGIDQ